MASSTGGMATNGGSSGRMGAGSGNMGGAVTGGSAGSGSIACPSTAPAKDDTCSAEGSCYYPGLRCDCQGKMDTLTWRCSGSGAACPTTAPADGEACTTDMETKLTCPYPDGSQCKCEQDAWKCDAPPDMGAGGKPGHAGNDAGGKPGRGGNDAGGKPGRGGAGAGGTPDMSAGGRAGGEPMTAGRGG
jgi:hypothetical protein